MFYLASPFSHTDPNIEYERYIAAQKFVHHCFKLGLNVFSPIAYGYPIHREFSVPGDAQTWRYFNESMIFRCDGLMILTLEGWDKSIGVMEEIRYAESHKKPIQRVSPVR